MHHVHSTTELVHLDRMCSLIRERKFTKIAELGTYLGGATIKFAEALESIGGGEIHAVDFDQKLLDEVVSNFNRNHFPRVVLTLYHGDLPEKIEALPDGLDFVFIDDRHESEHVRREIELLLPKMSPHGMIAGHDIANPQAPGIDAVFLSYGAELFDHGNGLGLIHLAASLTGDADGARDH